MAKTITKSIIRRPKKVDSDVNSSTNYTGKVFVSSYHDFNSVGIPANGTVTKAIIAAKVGSNNNTCRVDIGFGYNGHSDNVFLKKMVLKNASCSPQYFYNERTASEIASKLNSKGLFSGDPKSYFNNSDSSHLSELIFYRGPKTAIISSYDIDLYDLYVEVFYTVQGYTLTVNSSNTAHGTVSGGGDYESGATATLTATPKTGYKFVKWNDGNTSATRTVTVSADATYTATFEAIAYTVTFKNYDGTVLETKTVSHGSTPSYTGSTPTRASTAQYSYTFSGWSPSLSAITVNTTYTAQFTSTVRSYAITANAGTGGTVTGGGTYNYGSTATLTATASEGYKFKQWNDGDTSNPRTVTVTGTATYTATFESDKINKIYIGTSQPKEIYVGTTPVKAVYVGTTKVYG